MQYISFNVKLLTFYFLIFNLALNFNINADIQKNYDSFEISEIFVEANGNNKYEAKVKAYHSGMLRALHLICDRSNLKSVNYNNISYYDLKAVFKAIKVNNEISLAEKYSATVNFSYNKTKLYRLILDNGGNEIDDSFYELLVLPIYKQKNNLFIWENEYNWNKLWASKRPHLDDFKILFPETTLYYREKLKNDNIFKYKYNDFINIFGNYLFKNLMLISAEIFTDRQTANSVILVTKYLYNFDLHEAQITEEKYELNSFDDINNAIDNIINKIIDEYGRKRTSNHKEVIEIAPIKEIEVKKPIIMNYDVYEEGELDKIGDKLAKLPIIKNYDIRHDYANKYKIFIDTEADEFELAEALYMHGLSYKIFGKLYQLIDIKPGV